jgi:hypothetical protein
VIKLSDNIWFTRKARIQASIRLLANDNHSQLLLVFYSIIITSLSIILVKYPNIIGPEADLITVIMSVIILLTSLLVASKNFKGRALAYKTHYIELQKLYFEALSAEKNNLSLKVIEDKYMTLLERVENHTPMDDITFRVSARANLTTRKPNCEEIVQAYFYKALRFFILSILYLLPIIIIATFYMQKIDECI